MDKMTLYYSPTSPYVRKVMICAHELGLADRLELHPEKVTPVTPSADYARRNPLMKVPALGIADGRTLIDSAVICEYLDSLADHRFFPSGNARWNALRLQAQRIPARVAGREEPVIGERVQVLADHGGVDQRPPIGDPESRHLHQRVAACIVGAGGDGGHLFRMQLEAIRQAELVRTDHDFAHVRRRGRVIQGHLVHVVCPWCSDGMWDRK